MTEYERNKIDSDTLTTLLKGLKGPWFLKWDQPTGELKAQCCNCGKIVLMTIRAKTLVKELTSRLAHKCMP